MNARKLAHLAAGLGVLAASSPSASASTSTAGTLAVGRIWRIGGVRL